MNQKDGDDHQVGYGKPPRKHRFKKGQTGNPGGRPRKQPPVPADDSLAAIVKRVGGQRVEVRGEMLTLDEVAVLALYKKAMTGSAAAHAELSRLRKELGLLHPLKQRIGGVLLVPSAVPIDEWEAAAYRQQAQFRETKPDTDRDQADPAQPQMPRGAKTENCATHDKNTKMS